MFVPLAPPRTTSTRPLPGYDLPPVPPQGLRVILLRHGRSDLNDAGRYQGSSDQSRLTPRGQLASQQVGQYLRHCAIAHLYVSPLQRAQQTVQELLPQLTATSPIPITTVEKLREIDLPAWEGLRYDDVKIRFPDAYRCWQTAPEQFAMAPGLIDGLIDDLNSSPNDGQTDSSARPCPVQYPVRDLYQRARDFWALTLPKHRGQTLLVVSHGGTIQALVNTALGLPMARHHQMQQTHSGLTTLDFAAPALGAAQLKLLNLTTPIGEQLPKLKAGKQGLRLLLLPCQTGTEADAALAQLVQEQPITACMVEDQPCCHLGQRVFLSQHSETVTLSVGQSNFLHHWQRSLMRSLQQASATELTTVAAVCHQGHAESFLHQVMGYPLPLLPNTLSVLHYPSAALRPILQTLNSRPVSGQF